MDDRSCGLFSRRSHSRLRRAGARLRRREQEKLEWQAYDQPRWKLIAFSYAIALGIIILWPVLTVSAARTEAASKVEFDLLQPRSVEPSAALDRWVADIQNRYTNALPFEDYRETSSKLPWSNAGIDVEAAQRSHQLEVALPQDTYLQTGRFNKTPCSNWSRRCSGREPLSDFPSPA